MYNNNANKKKEKNNNNKNNSYKKIIVLAALVGAVLITAPITTAVVFANPQVMQVAQQFAAKYMTEDLRTVGDTKWTARWGIVEPVDPRTTSVFFGDCVLGEYPAAPLMMLGSSQLRVVESYVAAMPDGTASWVFAVKNNDRDEPHWAAFGANCQGDSATRYDRAADQNQYYQTSAANRISKQLYSFKSPSEGQSGTKDVDIDYNTKINRAITVKQNIKNIFNQVINNGANGTVVATNLINGIGNAKGGVINGVNIANLLLNARPESPETNDLVTKVILPSATTNVQPGGGPTTIDWASIRTEPAFEPLLEAPPAGPPPEITGIPQPGPGGAMPLDPSLAPIITPAPATTGTTEMPAGPGQPDPGIPGPPPGGPTPQPDPGLPPLAPPPPPTTPEPKSKEECDKVGGNWVTDPPTPTCIYDPTLPPPGPGQGTTEPLGKTPTSQADCAPKWTFNPAMGGICEPDPAGVDPCNQGELRTQTGHCEPAEGTGQPTEGPDQPVTAPPAGTPGTPPATGGPPPGTTGGPAITEPADRPATGDTTLQPGGGGAPPEEPECTPPQIPEIDEDTGQFTGECIDNPNAAAAGAGSATGGDPLAGSAGSAGGGPTPKEQCEDDDGIWIGEDDFTGTCDTSGGGGGDLLGQLREGLSSSEGEDQSSKTKDDPTTGSGSGGDPPSTGGEEDLEIQQDAVPEDEEED